MNNKLTDETLKAWKTEAMISLGETPKDCRDYYHHEAILALVTELQERRQADSAEPACYALTNMAGEVYNTHSSAQNAGAYRDLIHQSDDSLTLRVTPLYAVPPASVTGIYDDVLNIIGLLENNEWAEHCTSTVLGSLLESEITRLVSKEQPAPVVPDERAAFNAWNNEDNLPIAGVGAKNAAWLAWQARASLCGNSALNVPPERPADSSNGDDIEAWFDEGWNACRAAMLNGGKS